MWPFLKSLIWDETAFQRYGRMLIFGLGAAVSAGMIQTGIDGGGGKIGTALQLLAFMIRAGDKNPSQPS
jgi:hypothetical protein